jgi:hypothetical protein
MARAITWLGVLLVVGCTANPSAPPAPPPSTSTSTSAAPAAHRLEELQQHPCALLTSEEATAAGYTADGREGTNDYGEKICNWDKDGASIGFSAFPSSDVTRSPQATESRGRTTELHVVGQRAVQAEFLHACFLYVAAGPERSFRLSVVGSTPQDRLCPAATEFAALALSHIDAR